MFFERKTSIFRIGASNLLVCNAIDLMWSISIRQYIIDTASPRIAVSCAVLCKKIPFNFLCQVSSGSCSKDSDPRMYFFLIWKIHAHCVIEFSDFSSKFCEFHAVFSENVYSSLGFYFTLIRFAVEISEIIKLNDVDIDVSVFCIISHQNKQ